MATSFHKDQHLVDVYAGLTHEKEVHAPYSFEYADAAARLAATGFIINHVGKLARQISDNTSWILTNYSPIVWHRFDASGPASGIKSGKLIPGNFSGTPKKATVTFSSAFVDDGYTIVVLVLTDGSRTFSPAAESKAAGRFVVNLHSNNVAGLVEVGWHAIILGE